MPDGRHENLLCTARTWDQSVRGIVNTGMQDRKGARLPATAFHFTTARFECFGFEPAATPTMPAASGTGLALDYTESRLRQP
jgi:hypothetical protein